MTTLRIGPVVCFLALAGCAKPAPDAQTPLPVEKPLPVRPADGLEGPHADALRRLPRVHEVEVLVPVPHPARRIIHVRDWHFVPRDLYALDLRQAAGRPLTDQEVDDRFRELLREVDAVQREQEQILDALSRRHGLRRVLVEGLTPDKVADYREVLSVFKRTEDRVARVREQAAALGPGGGRHRTRGREDGAKPAS